jgi:uncharacterized protein involved in tolerance to divalent cations
VKEASASLYRIEEEIVEREETKLSLSTRITSHQLISSQSLKAETPGTTPTLRLE